MSTFSKLENVFLKSAKGWRVDSRKEQGLFSESGGRIGISCCRALIRDPTVAIRSGHCAGRRRPEQWRPRRRHWSTSSELVSGAIQAILKQTESTGGRRRRRRAHQRCSCGRRRLRGMQLRAAAETTLSEIQTNRNRRLGHGL